MFQKEVTELARQCDPGYYYCGGMCQSIPCYMDKFLFFEIILGAAAALIGVAVWSAYQAYKGGTNLPTVVRAWLAVVVTVIVGIIFAILGSAAVRMFLGRPGWMIEWLVTLVVGFAVSYLILGTVVNRLAGSEANQARTE